MNLWIYDRNQKEERLLLELSRNAVAYLSDEKLEVTVPERESLKERLHLQELLDAALWEIAEGRDVRLLKSVRKQFEAAELLIVAESTVSPMEYLTPDIRAASLLIRPFGKKQAADVLREFFCSVCSGRSGEEERVWPEDV